MKQFLNDTGLDRVLRSVGKRLANEAMSVFKTDPAWEVNKLYILEGWVAADNTAQDTINNRKIENYDVYLVKSTNDQYYFDSGAWVSFSPGLMDYYTKNEVDDLLPTALTPEAVNEILTSAGFPAVT